MKDIFMKVTSRHIGQIGRELVTDYVTALTELVKNSYDADAEAVQINYINVKSNSGKIILIDSGSGISRIDIENKWAVIGTNNKVRDAYSQKYKRRYSGKKGIGRFAVERLAEHCTLYSFTEEDCFKYHINWNVFEGINLIDFKQRLALLKYNNHDISTAKYIRSGIEYLIHSDMIRVEDKNIIKDILHGFFVDLDFICTFPVIEKIEKEILPIMEKYKDNEEMATQIRTHIEELSNKEKLEKKKLLECLYGIHGVDHHLTGLIIELEELRDTWTEKDVNKVNQEMQSLIAPSLIDDINFKVSINAPEFKVEAWELTNEITSMNFAELSATFSDKERKVRIIYKENKKETETDDIVCSNSSVCGDFSIKLFYFVRSSDYLKSDNLRTVKAREILDAFCGVKIYRDGFRVRPYGDVGNDWLMLDRNKIKDTHGYLVGNNQLIGVINLSQENNPLLVDSTNREAIIENEAFDEMKDIVKKTIGFIQNKRFEEFKSNEEKDKRETQKLIDEENKRRKISDKHILKILDNANTAIKTNDQDTAIKLAQELARKVEDERKYSEEAQQKERKLFEEQLFGKQRELDLYKNLASLGILAGTFGHETGDVLTRIANDIESMKDVVRLNGLSDQIANCTDRIDKDLSRVESYSKLLLSFLKKKNRDKKEFLDMKQIVIGLATLYNNIIKSFNVKIDLNSITDVVLDKKMYRIDFESIFINLMSNSFEAIKNKENKIVKISLDRTPLGEPRLTFEDSGLGIPKEKRGWILLPFSTTKDENGVGLGMTIVNDIVTRYGYVLDISVSKELGGAKITIIMGGERSND